LFERIVAKQLTFLANRIVSPKQHGFMPGRSAITNLAILFCIHSLNSHHQVFVVYTDFAKAFKIAKLQKLRFHLSILNWFKFYLDDRINRVETTMWQLLAFLREVHWVRFFSSSSLMISAFA